MTFLKNTLLLAAVVSLAACGNNKRHDKKPLQPKSGSKTTSEKVEAKSAVLEGRVYLGSGSATELRAENGDVASVICNADCSEISIEILKAGAKQAQAYELTRIQEDTVYVDHNNDMTSSMTYNYEIGAGLGEDGVRYWNDEDFFSNWVYKVTVTQVSEKEADLSIELVQKQK